MGIFVIARSSEGEGLLLAEKRIWELNLAILESSFGQGGRLARAENHLPGNTVHLARTSGDS